MKFGLKITQHDSVLVEIMLPGKVASWTRIPKRLINSDNERRMSRNRLDRAV